MNPTVSQRVVDEAAERDPAFAEAEYMAEFRTDIESFVSRDVIEALIQPGTYECLPRAINTSHSPTPLAAQIIPSL